MDYGNHCLRLINRITLQTSLYAGLCESRGHADGTSSARFRYPYSIIRDMKQPHMLLVTDQLNHALRHVDTQSRSPHHVSTFIESSVLSYPTGLVQDPLAGDLYITATHQIYKLIYSTKSLQLVSGSQSSGFRDGDFSTALFDSCLLYTSPSPRDGLLSRMPSSA